MDYEGVINITTGGLPLCPRTLFMPTIWSRLLALELLAKLNGLRLDYAVSQQNGRDCWYVATISMLREKGYPLKGVDARSLRAKSRDWLLARHDEFKLFGDDYWSFIDNWKCAWVTNLAIIAALSVLSEDLEMNLEMVALSTTGSDYLNPVCSQSAWAETIRLVYAYDREKHYVPLHNSSNPACPARTQQLAAQRAAAQHAAEQRAAERRAAAQCAAEQRAAEQYATEQRAAESRAAEQREAEQRCAACTLQLAAQRVAAQRGAEQPGAAQHAAEGRAAEKRATEQHPAEQHAADCRAAEQREAEQQQPRAAEQLGMPPPSPPPGVAESDDEPEMEEAMQVEEPVVQPVIATQEERLRLVMESLPGVSGVSDKPIGKGVKANDHGVRWYLNGNGGRCACTNANGVRPTLLHARLPRSS